MPQIARIAFGTFASLALLGSTLSAQGSLRDQTRARRSAAPAGALPTRIIAINPFIPLAGYFQGEYEQRVQQNLSVAVAGSYAPFDNRDYTNADVKLRLYPNDRALEGLGVAAGVGIGRARQDDLGAVCLALTCPPAPGKGKMLTAPTFSIEAQYQWLLGTSRSTAVTVGGGLKRYYFDEADTEGRGVDRLLPTGRLTIGWAFR